MLWCNIITLWCYDVTLRSHDVRRPAAAVGLERVPHGLRPVAGAVPVARQSQCQAALQSRLCFGLAVRPGHPGRRRRRRVGRKRPWRRWPPARSDHRSADGPTSSRPARAAGSGPEGAPWMTPSARRSKRPDSMTSPRFARGRWTWCCRRSSFQTPSGALEPRSPAS